MVWKLNRLFSMESITQEPFDFSHGRFRYYNGKRLYVKNEKVYYEDNGKIIHIVGMYFCPFCGRQFEDSRIGHRKFRGE